MKTIEVEIEVNSKIGPQIFNLELVKEYRIEEAGSIHCIVKSMYGSDEYIIVNDYLRHIDNSLGGIKNSSSPWIISPTICKEDIKQLNSLLEEQYVG